MHTQTQTGVEIEHLRWNSQDRVSNIAKVHTKSELSSVIERRERLTTTADALHLQRLLDFVGVPVKLRLRIDSTTARGFNQGHGCGPLKHIETGLVWLQAKHEEIKLTVIKEPTQTKTADGFTKA